MNKINEHICINSSTLGSSLISIIFHYLIFHSNFILITSLLKILIFRRKNPFYHIDLKRVSFPFVFHLYVNTRYTKSP